MTTTINPGLLGAPTGVGNKTQQASAVQPAETRPPYVKLYASSIFAIAMLFLVGVGWPASIYLDDYMGGFGLGGMCALWGGPSFGVMAGSARVSAWYDRHPDQHL